MVIKMNKVYIKSPLNYIGGKYKLLPQLIEFFPNFLKKLIHLQIYLAADLMLELMLMPIQLFIMTSLNNYVI